MFDFEKLTVYQKAKEFNKQVFGYISTTKAWTGQAKTNSGELPSVLC